VSYSPGISLAHGVPVAVSVRREQRVCGDGGGNRESHHPAEQSAGPQFPDESNGRDDDARRTREDRAVVQRHNLLVITDEIYSELTFEGEHVSIASLPGMIERTIFLHGFSKAYAMTGFRIGYACGPVEIIEAMMRIHQYSMLCASIISQEAAIEAIEHGEPDTTEMREQYRLRRNFIVNALNEMGLKCHLPRGSFYAFPCIQSTA
jgi:aminotransferase